MERSGAGAKAWMASLETVPALLQTCLFKPWVLPEQRPSLQEAIIQWR